MAADLSLTLDFLRDLRANNTKAWFDAHRSDYDAARRAFTDFVTAVLADFNNVDELGTVAAADCIYRINRDVRFSPDKSPYKTSMSAVLAKGGRKPLGRSYYVHIEPDGGSFIGGGLYDPSSQQLERVRHAIARNAAGLRAVLADPTFIRTFGEVRGEQLKVAPQGYPKDHPAIDLLRHKQFMATHPLSDADVVGEDLVPQVLDVCRALRPFVTCLHDYLAG